MLIGMSFASMFSPLNAQRDGIFSEIQCNKLTVVDASGNEGIKMEVSSVGSSISVDHPSGSGSISILAFDPPLDNRITIFDPEGKTAILLDASSRVNGVSVYDKNVDDAVHMFHSKQLGNGLRVYNPSGSLAWKAP